jgi:hypothetical protein
VNALLPGLVDGERIRKVFENKAAALGIAPNEQEAAALAHSSLRRLVPPRELAPTSWRDHVQNCPLSHRRDRLHQGAVQARWLGALRGGGSELNDSGLPQCRSSRGKAVQLQDVGFVPPRRMKRSKECGHCRRISLCGVRHRPDSLATG